MTTRENRAKRVLELHAEHPELSSLALSTRSGLKCLILVEELLEQYAPGWEARINEAKIEHRLARQNMKYEVQRKAVIEIFHSEPHLTLFKLGKRAGVSEVTVSRWLNADVKDWKETSRKARKALDPVREEVVRLYEETEDSMAKIGKAQGVTRARVQQILIEEGHEEGQERRDNLEKRDRKRRKDFRKKLSKSIKWEDEQEQGLHGIVERLAKQHEISTRESQLLLDENFPQWREELKDCPYSARVQNILDLWDSGVRTLEGIRSQMDDPYTQATGVVAALERYRKNWKDNQEDGRK